MIKRGLVLLVDSSTTKHFGIMIVLRIATVGIQLGAGVPVGREIVRQFIYQPSLNSNRIGSRGGLDLKLQQYSNEEIKERIGRSERTVGRILQRIRQRLDEMLADETVSDE